MVPGHKRRVERLAFSEIGAHKADFFVRKIKCIHHMAIENVRGLQFADQCQTAIVAYIRAQQIAIAHTVVIDPRHCKRIAGKEEPQPPAFHQ